MIKHPYHLVDYSPWPFVGACRILSLAGGIASWIQGFDRTLVWIGSVLLLFAVVQWSHDSRLKETRYIRQKFALLGIRIQTLYCDFLYLCKKNLKWSPIIITLCCGLCGGQDLTDVSDNIPYRIPLEEPAKDAINALLKHIPDPNPDFDKVELPPLEPSKNEDFSKVILPHKKASLMNKTLR